MSKAKSNQSAGASTQNKAPEANANAEANAEAQKQPKLLTNASAKLAKMLAEAEADKTSVNDMLHQTYTKNKEAKNTIVITVSNDKMQFKLTKYQATTLQNANLIANAKEASRISYNSDKAPKLFAKVYDAIQKCETLKTELQIAEA